MFTTEVPFYDHQDQHYAQCDGVSMSFVLGLTFNNFYRTNLEITYLIPQPPHLPM